VPPDHVVVVPNGIDPDEYVLADEASEVAGFRQRLGIDDARFILFLGRLNPIKGPDLLLEAFSHLSPSARDVHLVLAGPDGGMRALLEQSAAAFGLNGRVHFTGYVGGFEKVAALHAATVLAIPSRREAMSIVVLEGGICGCPVVFTDTCGLDAISRENAGVMVPVSVAAIAEALENLLQSPEELRRSGERLQRIVRQHYLWRSQARRLLTLAEQVISHHVQTKAGNSVDR
jgi:glycosyltransferase involved in cell wall biosynthesis